MSQKDIWAIDVKEDYRGGCDTVKRGKLNLNCIFDPGGIKSRALLYFFYFIFLLWPAFGESSFKRDISQHLLFYLNVTYLPLIYICVPVFSCSSVYVYMFVFWVFLCLFFFFCDTIWVFPQSYVTLSFLFNLCSISKTSTAFCLAAILLSFYSHSSCMSVGVLYGCVLHKHRNIFCLTSRFFLTQK